MFTRLKDQLKGIGSKEQPDYILRFFLTQIENGHLIPGDKIPAVRDLSAVLQINYATVLKAYHQCKLAGIITSTPRKGSFICDKELVQGLQNRHDLTTMNSPLSEHSENLSLQLRQQAITATYHYDFKNIFKYQQTTDNIVIKQTGIHWLRKKVNQPLASRILPCSGIHEGLVALFMMLQKTGAIALPQFFYSGLTSIVRLLNTPYVTVDCDREGPLPESLTALCEQQVISAIYLNPNINNPTTATLSINRRLALVEIARRFDIAIIEDDAYGALTTHGIATLSQIAPERTWYLNGLSKSFAPGMRIAWIYGPSDTESSQLAAILKALKVSDNPLTHHIVNLWVNSGVAQLAAYETRVSAKKRVKLFKRLFKDDDYQIDEEGFHVWFNLGEKNAYEVAFLLQQAGLSAAPSNEFCLTPSTKNYLQLSLSAYDSLYALELALKKFRDVLNAIYMENPRFKVKK